MKTATRMLLLFLCTAGAARSVCAQNPVRINLGTVAPNGSLWYEVLLRMSQDMQKGSGEKVLIKIYENGRQGDENEMLRRVRQRTTLSAVAVSGVGLGHIDGSLSALQIPLLIDSYAQLDYVRKQIEPKFERILESKGFIVLNWSDVGWVHFFTKKPARTPDDIRALKLFTSAGDPNAEQLYKEFGLNPVQVGADELVTSLQTGHIEAFDVPPLFALANQSFGLAKNMIDMKWAPLIGATLLSRKAWEEIPEPLRPEMLRIARRAGEDLRGKIRQSGDDAVLQMVKRGLKVIRLTDAERTEWRKQTEAAYPKIRGKLVPPDLFDEVVRLSKEYRNQ